ncbi:hypothetical protein V7201_12020 [Bacillus sp. JJ1122]|uniref:hypothetical protein n=1 Tax=Bacillus sp. JJ1122 TaxID=3122951 RepID=UPI002FFDA03B
MALTSIPFSNMPYWLGFVFAGQAFTLSHRTSIPPGQSLNIQITTGKDTITHITDRRIVSQSEQLGIKLLKNPAFTHGNRKLSTINLDDRSKFQAATSFYKNPSNIHGGTVMEETMIPRYAFTQGGTPIESTSYERILQFDSNYILIIKNEGFYPTNVALNMAFYESGN